MATAHPSSFVNRMLFAEALWKSTAASATVVKREVQCCIAIREGGKAEGE